MTDTIPARKNRTNGQKAKYRHNRNIQAKAKGMKKSLDHAPEVIHGSEIRGKCIMAFKGKHVGKHKAVDKIACNKSYSRQDGDDNADQAIF